MLKSTKGQVTVFYGDGRGKTSAAMGEVLAAVSNGLKVCVVFFIKGKRRGAEYQTLTDLAVEYSIFGRSGFLSGADAEVKDLELAIQALSYAGTQIKSGRYDLIVLDEINNAQHYGLLTVDDILRLLELRPPHVSLLFTGKSVDQIVAGAADHVCAFRKIKHPYDKGVLARRGFDF